MAEAPAPWLTIVGIGEDGAAGLSPAARAAIACADLVTGSARHLALLPDLAGTAAVWPVPFADGIAPLIARRGKPTVLLASGDPFWFGAGTAVTRELDPADWIAYPALSAFARAAARLGWALDATPCLGLHAAPPGRLRPHLARGRRLLVLVRDGAAAGDIARYLADLGFGASIVHVLEALGGPRERVRRTTASAPPLPDIAHPVALGLEIAGDGDALPCRSGLPDGIFAHDGQLTRRPVRALTLSALAPRPGEMLWDIGAGSGSIGIEWLLAHPANRATAFEADPVRAARARGNAAALGVDRLAMIEGRAPGVLAGRPTPDAVFVGGGLSEALLDALCAQLPAGTRLVANAVTLESEGLLARWHAAKGGALLRVALAEATPLGTRRGWRASYPLVQWSVTL